MTTTFEHATDDELHRKLAIALSANGWLVIGSPHMETFAEVSERFGLKKTTLHKRLRTFFEKACDVYGYPKISPCHGLTQEKSNAISNAHEPN